MSSDSSLSLNIVLCFYHPACKKDCTVAAADPECDGRPDDIGTPMYSTADLCCSSKLNWIPKETCVQASTTGIDASDADSPGTGEWRKNTSWSACVLGEFVKFFQSCVAQPNDCSSHHLTNVLFTSDFNFYRL